ncbi:MAG: tRNA (N(6)-L-threonylcarbamoyladenosine(37)-C(2))-methylthiotransferase MtaB [Bacteroidetes bacterium]|nr:tRNA (N(6)-L-threonylcarbamoyladenosine(37)-C(2))-methylthiotransferase MtaB [Bacteroidota bacterium]
MPKVAFYTLGCKLNFSETSTIGEQFLNKGFNIVEFKDHADVYVINTCTVTDNADKECRQIVRRALRENPNAFIAVTGCYAQLRPDEIAEIEGVDAVFGSNEKFKIFSILESFEKKELSCIYVADTEELNNEFNSAHSTDADSRTRAFFKIQDGCDYKCTFCTIPLARGKSRSMHHEEVISQFKQLVNSGYKEIILTGVNVGDYGNSSDIKLYDILKDLVEIPGDFRIRISSIEPNLLTEDIIKLTAENKKLCSHFHIPLQSGSSDVLKLMQRRYNASFYKDRINKIKELIPDCGIGVDVIVGSPGETHERFLETYNFIKDLPISYLHVFTYSERPNTKAINMQGNVEIAERRKRNNMLRILSEKKRNEFYRSMIGKELEVIFEHQNYNGFMKGFSSNYVRIINSFNENLINKITPVLIKEIKENEGIAETYTVNNTLTTLAG